MLSGFILFILSKHAIAKVKGIGLVSDALHFVTR
jgi:hypothetical protein